MFKANPLIQEKVTEILKDNDTVDWIVTWIYGPFLMVMRKYALITLKRTNFLKPQTYMGF